MFVRVRAGLRERERQIDKVFISFYFIHLFLLFLINVGF